MFLCVAVTVILLVCKGKSQEPQCVCSKYHYEEQMLEKSIRTEIKFEDLQRKVESSLMEATEKYNKLTTLMAEWKEENDRERENALASIVEEKTKLNDTVVKINQLAENAITEDILFKAKTLSSTSPGVNTIIFTNTLYNYGGGYDNKTGVFTAPVAGTYLFTGQLCNSKNAAVFFGILMDGQEVTRGYSYDEDGRICFNFNAIIKVGKSSDVAIKSYYVGSRLHQDIHRINTFSGVLLHK